MPLQNSKYEPPKGTTLEPLGIVYDMYMIKVTYAAAKAKKARWFQVYQCLGRAATEWGLGFEGSVGLG